MQVAPFSGHVSLPVIIYSYTDLVEFEGTGQANLKQKPP